MTSNKPDPNVRPFLLDLERIVDNLKHELPCCINCISWDKHGEQCTYNNQRVRPPAEVIAFGCWAFNKDVPF